MYQVKTGLPLQISTVLKKNNKINEKYILTGYDIYTNPKPTIPEYNYNEENKQDINENDIDSLSNKYNSYNYSEISKKKIYKILNKEKKQQSDLSIKEPEISLSEKQKNVIERRILNLIKRNDDKIEKYTDSVSNRIIKSLEKPIKKSWIYIDTSISIIFTGIDSILLPIAKNVGLEYTYKTISNTSERVTKNNISEKYNAFVTDSLNNIISDILLNSIEKSISGSLTKASEEIIINGVINYNKWNLGKAVSNIDEEFIKNLKEELYNQLISKQISLIKETDTKKTIISIKNQLLSDENLILASKEITTKGNKLNKSLKGTYKAASNWAGDNVDIDFKNLGKVFEGTGKNKNDKKGGINLKNKDVALKFGPSYIEIDSKIASLKGYVKMTEDDPTWGDSWQGELNAIINILTDISIYAKYINGKTTYDPKFSYWFLDVGVNGIKIPLPAPFVITGLRGKVYNHMSGMEEEVLPDLNVKFGAGLQIFLADASSGGNAVAFDVGAEFEYSDPDYKILLFGNLGVSNELKGGLIESSLVEGYGEMSYSSATDEFRALFEAEFIVENVLCAGGSFEAQIMPGYFKAALGQPTKPIFIKVLCKDFVNIEGWFIVSSDYLDMGLVLGVDASAETGKINVCGAKFSAYSNLFFEFGGSAKVIWKPFDVERAAIWIAFMADLGVWYDIGSGGKDITLVGITVEGEVIFTTVPKSNISGMVNCEVEIVTFNVGFDFNFSKDF